MPTFSFQILLGRTGEVLEPPVPRDGQHEGEPYSIRATSLSSGGVHDFELKWVDRRVVDSFKADGVLEKVTLRTPRTATLRIVMPSVLLVAGIRRKLTLMRSLAWPSDQEPALREPRLNLRAMLEGSSFKQSFQNGMTDIAVDDVPVARVANVCLVAKAAKRDDVVDLLEGTRATVQSVELVPWDEGVTKARVTSKGHVELAGPDMDDPFASYEAFRRIFLDSPSWGALIHG